MPSTLVGLSRPSLTGLPSHRHRPRDLWVGARLSDGCRDASRPAISAAAHHDCPDHPRRLVGERDGDQAAGLRDKRSAQAGSTASGLYLARRISEVMPTTSSRRRYLSLHLRDPSQPLLPPLECCNGSSPARRRTAFRTELDAGRVTEAASAVAHTVPIPGIVASRLAMSFERCQTSSSRSISPSRACRSRICPARPADHLAASGGMSGTSCVAMRLASISACSMPRRIHAELRQQAGDHADQLGALFDEQVPRAVQRQRRSSDRAI